MKRCIHRSIFRFQSMALVVALPTTTFRQIRIGDISNHDLSIHSSKSVLNDAASGKEVLFNELDGTNCASDEAKKENSKSEVSPSAIGHSVLVTKLSINTNSDDVERHFEDCGKVVLVHGLNFDRKHDDFYASCVVCFETTQAAHQACKKKHLSRLRTFRIAVEMLPDGHKIVLKGIGKKLTKKIAELTGVKSAPSLHPH